MYLHEYDWERIDEALEKTKPMKPEEKRIMADGREIIPCGNCGEELEDRYWDFCPWCGQRIGW